MKLELKSFQETAAREVITRLDKAREGVNDSELEAIILSAPTGSGKTITLAEVIDLTFGGGDGIPARPHTVFLWLSDSPELNVQSRNKLITACDQVPFYKMEIIESETFDADHLEPGYVYFINTQLLGRDKLLTQERGDKRQFTFWHTVANTVSRSPDNFVLIIDEAHRGATATDRNRTTIMQRFILGSPEDGLPPVPIVLGMSATPQRFTTLLGTTSRTQRPVNILPEDVRVSGLLKDIIYVRNPKSTGASDLTLLESAAEAWKYFTQLWGDYCVRENEKEVVRPILVVQIEDGQKNILTRTPLDDVVRIIERKTGTLGINEIVHCLQDQAEIQAGGRIIRKLEASRIQDNPEVKVVLFKTALTTGWDCPRAEVMMSFRRAQDADSIAQLVGRMIRTPLARRIVTNEVLDTVELFLPHYNADALETVLKRLRNPDAENHVATRVETSIEIYSRNPVMESVFEPLKELPTYAISRVQKMSDIKRALRLAAMLVYEGLNLEAEEHVRSLLIEKLREIRDDCAAKDLEWNNLVHAGGEIEVDITQVSIGQMSVTGKKSARVVLSPENIEHLFDNAGRLLAAGEGLHRTYWRRYHDPAKPAESKLELFAIVRQPGTLLSLQELAKDQFDSLWKKHRSDINDLPASTRTRFHNLVLASGKAVLVDWELPEQIVEKKDNIAWENHLYTNTSGEFFAKLNTWEAELIKTEIQKPDFVGWLRNLARREWALCIPYELAGLKGFYPDFVIIRKSGRKFQFDLLEPHDDSRTDTWAKAKGLAVFADEHGMNFGRLTVARKKSGHFQFADMNDFATRNKARRLQSNNDLEGIFS